MMTMMMIAVTSSCHHLEEPQRRAAQKGKQKPVSAQMRHASRHSNEKHLFINKNSTQLKIPNKKQPCRQSLFFQS